MAEGIITLGIGCGPGSVTPFVLTGLSTNQFFPSFADAPIGGAYGVRLAISVQAGALGALLADAPLAGAHGVKRAAAVSGGHAGSTGAISVVSGRTGRK